MIIPELEHIKEHGKIYTGRYIKIHYPEFYEHLQQYPGEKITEKMWRYFYGDPNDCIVCGKPTKFLNFNTGYSQTCCIQCSGKNPLRMSKASVTKLKKYGDAGYNNRAKMKETCEDRYGGVGLASAEIKERVRQTCENRYGVSNISSITRDKAKKTCMERYGVENSLQLPSTQRAAREALIKKYGTDKLFMLEEIQQKSHQTKRERYGNENYSNTEQRRQTMLERYGVENFTNPEKIKQTCLERYGVENPSQVFGEKISHSKTQSTIEHYDYVLGYTEDGDWICKCPHPDCNKCQEHSYIISPTNRYNRELRGIEICTNLKPINVAGDTNIEMFIERILQNNNIQYEKHERTILNGKELDFYIPALKLAIECNGVFFHSTSAPNPKHPKYHINKFEICKSFGITLLQFWEDQILNTPRIVESILLNKLGKTPSKIYARHCQIKQIDSCDEFLRSNHIQGNAGASVKLGLYHKDELVSVMTFGKRKGVVNRKGGDWELIRFCNKLYTNVVGGAGKLLKYFIRTHNPNEIISYSSNDISTGKLYKILGFISNENISPSYWYVDQRYQRYHRAKFTRQKLKQMGYVEGTESEIMKSLKYYKIYDSGTMRWIYTKEPQ